MAIQRTVLVALLALLGVSAWFPAVNAVAVAKKCTFAQWKNPANLGTRYIYVGTKCTWTWADNLSHCVEGYNKPAGFSGPVLAGKGSTWSFTFKKTGTFKFVCCLHLANMRGTIVVLNRPKTSPAPSKCVPKCAGRCWGGDTCGGRCARFYPNPPTIAKCNTCCKKDNKNTKSVAACYAACRKS